MARYRGSKHKLARREGVNILEKTSASLTRRLNIPPGIHGKKLKRRRSEFGQQLREKQKAKATYGILEKQFAGLVKTVQKKKGETGEMIIALLETRLDNLAYRMGFAKTRFMARQLVSHGHIYVDGKKVTIPSFQVRENSIVSISPKMAQTLPIQKLLDEKQDVLPFLTKKDKISGFLVRMPKREDVQVPFDVQLIIEYYSR